MIVCKSIYGFNQPHQFQSAVQTFSCCDLGFILKTFFPVLTSHCPLPTDLPNSPRTRIADSPGVICSATPSLHNRCCWYKMIAGYILIKIMCSELFLRVHFKSLPLRALFPETISPRSILSKTIPIPAFSITTGYILETMAHLMCNYGFNICSRWTYLQWSYLIVITWSICSPIGAVVEYLLDAGANINLRRDDHRNALNIASIKGHTEIVSILTKRGQLKTKILPWCNLGKTVVGVLKPNSRIFLKQLWMYCRVGEK